MSGLSRRSVASATGMALLSGVLLTAGATHAAARPEGDDFVKKEVPSKLWVGTFIQNGGCITAAQQWITLAPGAALYEWRYTDNGNPVTGSAPPFAGPDDSGRPRGSGGVGIAASHGSVPCENVKPTEDYYRGRFAGVLRAFALFPVGQGFIRGTVKAIDCSAGMDDCKPAKVLRGATIAATRNGKTKRATSGPDGSYLISGKPGAWDLTAEAIADWRWLIVSRRVTVTKNGTVFANFTVRIPPGRRPRKGDDGGLAVPPEYEDPWAANRSVHCPGPDNGLTSCWKAEGDGADAIGENDGTMVGGPIFDRGVVGKAFEFDGNDAVVRIDDDPSLRFGPGDRMSVAMWVLRTDAAAPQHLLGKRAGCNGDDFGYQLVISDGDLYFGAGIGGQPSYAIADDQPPLWRWTHVAGTQDGDTWRLYIDGTLADTTGGSFGAKETGDLRIGGSSTCRPFGGLLDEVELWSRALSDDEVADTYRADADCDRRPSGPRGLTARNGTTIDADKPLLDWTAAGCARNYKLEVHQGSRTGPLEVSKAGLDASQLAVALPAGATWWWRATACNPRGCTSGDWETFKTVS